MSDSDPCEGGFMPQPSEQHQELMSHVGTWDVHCTYHTMGEPFSVEAVEEISAVGGFWTSSIFRCEFMGMPYEGRCQMGYDSDASQFVATWIDVMSPRMVTLEGNKDADGVLRMTGKSINPTTQQMADVVSESTFRDDGKMLFTMSFDGVLAFEYLYSKRS